MGIKKVKYTAFFLVVQSCLMAQVGIGTASPSEALDIEDSTSTSIGINNTDAGDPIIHFQVINDTIFTIGVDNSVGDKFKIGKTKVDTVTSITIDENGYVGINDTNPAYRLEVDGNINLSSSTDVYRVGSAHCLSKPNTKNIYVGQGAGAQNNAGGTDNTYVGYQAGYSSTTGDYNVAFGNEAAYANQSGSNNLLIGYQAGYSASSASTNIKIGHQAGYGSTSSNSLYIDNSSAANPLLYVSDFSSTEELTINGALIVNEQSGTFDFRVESDNNENMLNVDATNDYVFVNTNNNVTNRQIQVNSADAAAGLSILRHSTDAEATRLSFVKARGTEGSPSIALDNDNLGSIKFVGYDGLDFNHTSVTIEGKVDGTPGTDDMPTELRFQTTADGSNSQSIRMVIRSSGNVGIGDTSPGSKLDVEEDGATVATFNRLTSNGTIIDFQQAGSSEGSITFDGTNVLYNAFTGAHYGYSNDSLEYGMVVVLNGENQRFHNIPNSEIIYGINYSSAANDKRVLGVYSNVLEETKDFSIDNPYLVMAVGNGVMWVTNEGGDIQVGDYLITSSTVGMAMKDQGLFTTSYVCARAAVNIDWSTVSADDDGVKKTLLPVFYESFEIENVSKEIETLEREIMEFKNSLYKL